MISVSVLARSPHSLGFSSLVAPALMSNDYMERAIWQQHTNRLESQVAHRRFLNTDVPMAMALTAASFIGFLALDSQTQAVNSLSKLAQHRQKALDASKYLRHQNVDALGHLGLLELAMKLGESPGKIMPLYRQFTLKNASHPGLSPLRQAVSSYMALYQTIVDHPKRLQQMMVPAIVRPLKMSDYQAKVLAKSQPAELIRKIFQTGFKSEMSSGGFFKRIMTGLVEANWWRAGILSGSVFALLMGAYVTRMEMKMKDD